MFSKSVVDRLLHSFGGMGFGVHDVDIDLPPARAQPTARGLRSAPFFFHRGADFDSAVRDSVGPPILATQLSLDRLARLVELAAAYDGPVSAVIMLSARGEGFEQARAVRAYLANLEKHGVTCVFFFFFFFFFFKFQIFIDTPRSSIYNCIIYKYSSASGALPSMPRATPLSPAGSPA
jgi:hypothetical protein